ncbi:MAG: 6-carboxytetrahydropterin synthase QueD [Methanophagales archaeon]|nr:6-carboxytetrahydropterin synthase QueD [Methanophagales archaeon]
MKLGVSADFSAAHSLSRHPGKCKNLHGHTYKVDVVVEGEKREDTGCVADFADIKAVIEDVVTFVDHKYLNEVIHYPTTENIALFIKAEIEKRLNRTNLGVTLRSVRIWEGREKWVMVE